jgi:formamidopyrimidine-DNA glycosylase
MPEIPDLQVFADTLNKKFSGKKLQKIKFFVSKKFNASEKQFNNAVSGHVLEKVYRDGKQLHFIFDNEQVIGLHLMLHGELHYESDKVNPKTHIMLWTFEGSESLLITDFHKQARPTLNPTATKIPDILDKKVNAKFLSELLKKGGNKKLKAYLTDQSVIRGMGNAYSDEIYYEAGISPFSRAGKVPADKIPVLLKAIKKVYKNAIKQIKKMDPDHLSGEIRSFLKVHLPRTEKTKKGEKILIEKGNGKTYYVKGQKKY